MTISAFEAIGFYEFNRKKNTENIKQQFNLIIFNVDDYSVGFCSCSEEGQIKIIDSKSLNIETSCIDDIEICFRDMSKRQDSMFDLVRPCIEKFNNKMKIYYQSEYKINSNFKDILDLDWDCVKFNKIFSTAGSNLKKLLNCIDDFSLDTKFDESEYSFIIVGKAALYYPIKHFIKEFFVFEPFLPDNRFVSDMYTDKADEIIDIGMKEYERKKQQEREIYINVIDGDGVRRKNKIFVLDKIEDGEQIKYLEPMFISADDKLEFEINSQKNIVDIPYSIDSIDYDIIEVGAFLRDNKPIARIRRYNHPTRIYDICVV